MEAGVAYLHAQHTDKVVQILHSNSTPMLPTFQLTCKVMIENVTQPNLFYGVCIN